MPTKLEQHAAKVIDDLSRSWRMTTRVVAFWLLAACLMISGPAAANPKYAGMVIDATSGEVLYSSRADKRLYPASLTKMMTLYLTFRAVADGRLSLNSTIKISRNAANEPPSRIGFRVGDRIKVEQAIYALVTKSANDVATALGERLGGSEKGFAQKANEMARQLGMQNTTFRNAHGLPNREQKSTARDMAKLGQALIRDFPQYYHYFSTQRWTFRGTTYRSHNKLMAKYPGMDGLKTGYIRAAGYNLVASAKRGELRLIGVVFGGRSSARRNNHMADILDRAFTSERGQYLISQGSAPSVPLPSKRPNLDVLVASTPSGGLAFSGNAQANAALGFSAAGNGQLAGLNPPSPSALPDEAQAITLLGAPIAPGRPDRPIFVSDGPIPEPVFGLPLPLARPSLGSDTQIVTVPPTGATTNQPAPALATEAPSSIGDLLAMTAFSGTSIGQDDGSTWSVQLGAFSRPDDAERILLIAKNHLENVTSARPNLKNAQRLLMPYSNDAERLYRARLTGLDERDATNACALLAGISLDCIIVPPVSISG
ncbi:MAG: serine hydrolase [Pseudomonadota bacterium]